MRILKIVNSNDTGGVFTCESQFLRLLRERGVDVDLIIIGNGDKLKIYEDLADEKFYLPQTDFLFSGSALDRLSSLKKAYLFGKKFAKEILKTCIKKDYQAIIYRRENLMFLSGLISKKLNVPCYWHMANSVGNNTSKVVYQAICRYLNIIPIANSEYTRISLGANFCKYVIYPGYNEQRLKSGNDSFRKKYISDKQNVIFGMLTRIEEDKAVEIVIKAFIKSEAFSDSVLIIAGGPLTTEYSKFCQSIVKEYSNIVMIGPITEVGDFYSSVDIMINGRRNAEPFGITIAESLFASKPIIAYYKGGPSEMIKEGENGWLVYDPTIDAYKDAINISIRDRLKWREMGIKGRKLSEKYSASVNVDKLIKILVNQYTSLNPKK
ncbi:glycosyltransferase family 4 protein [Sphingobacterium sp. NPDC055431]